MDEEQKFMTCTGKFAFLERALALKAAKRVKGRDAYRCKVCGYWHVGEHMRRVARYKRHNRTMGQWRKGA